VVDHHNTTNLEWSLAEDLIAHTLNDLKTLPLHTGLVAPRPAPRAMIRTLTSAFGSWVATASITTATEARHGPIKIHQGDVVAYTSPGGRLMAGDVWFFASCATWGGDVAFVGNWERLDDAASSEFWRFERFENLGPIGMKLDLIMDTCIANMGGAIVTVLSPLMTR
jgi:hypothetical protein